MLTLDSYFSAMFTCRYMLQRLRYFAYALQHVKAYSDAIMLMVIYYFHMLRAFVTPQLASLRHACCHSAADAGDAAAADATACCVIRHYRYGI